jgi:hypothetical protein
MLLNNKNKINAINIPFIYLFLIAILYNSRSLPKWETSVLVHQQQIKHGLFFKYNVKMYSSRACVFQKSTQNDCLLALKACLIFINDDSIIYEQHFFYDFHQ